MTKKFILLVLAACLGACAAETGEPDESATDDVGEITALPQALAAGDQFVFQNENSKDCLGVDRASTQPAALIKQFACDCGPNQQWTLDTKHVVVQNHRALVNFKSKMCMGVDGGATKSVASIMQFACDQKSNQQWSYEEQGKNNLGEPTIRFKNASGLCLGVDGASKSSGAQIKQFPCDGKNNQRWIVQSPAFCSL